MEAYSASRPPHSEGLAIAIAAYLAHATDLPTINLLHLSGAAAMESALLMAAAFPHIDFRREVTIGPCWRPMTVPQDLVARSTRP